MTTTIPDLLQLTATTIEPLQTAKRNHEIETLWYQLSTTAFDSLVLVPVQPGVTGRAVAALARALATVGASVTRRPIILVNATTAVPAATEESTADLHALQELGLQSIVVAKSPISEAGSLPIIQMCSLTVLVVGLGTSSRDDVGRIQAMLSGTPIAGVVCIDGTAVTPTKARRGKGRQRAELGASVGNNTALAAGNGSPRTVKGSTASPALSAAESPAEH